MSIGVDDGTCLVVNGSRNEHRVGLFGSGIGHEHSLGGGGSTVVHGGVGDVHACETCHDALIFKDIVQGAL